VRGPSPDPEHAVAIEARAVSKSYRLYGKPSDRLRELLLRTPRHRDFQALSDVSFDLPAGKALGLIGENGAGKSTLLKIVAGTTSATSGTVVRRGVVASILELGMGFHPEFTGRENARMNAALLGLTGSEIRRRLPEMQDFIALLCDEAIWLKNGIVAGQGRASEVVRGYERFLQDKERRFVDAPGTVEPLPVGTNGRRPARIVDVVVHDGSGYPRSEFASGETVAVDVAFESADPSLLFHVRVGADREDGVQAFAVDTRNEPWAPLTGRSRYRLRLLLPELPIVQGEFRLYVFLGDETALHLHDLKVLHPGFTMVAPEYSVGLMRPPHLWSVEPVEAVVPPEAEPSVARR
jgi:ABC-type polysaccharide/polyol phosphate transport system ATPase subunit